MNKLFGLFQTVSMYAYGLHIRKKHIIATLILIVSIITGRVSSNLIGKYKISLLEERKFMEALNSQIVQEISCNDDFKEQYQELIKDDMHIDESSIYASHKLIVIADNDNFETYGAISAVEATNMYVLKYDSDSATEKAYKKLLNNENITYVEVDEVINSGSNDEIEENSEEVSYNEDEQEYEYEETELKKYLETLNVKENKVVAIIDSGVSSSESLDSEMILSSEENYSNTGEKNSTEDDNGHGTEIAEIIEQNSDSYILPIKIANSEGQASIVSAYMAIKFAIEEKVDIINISMNAISSNRSAIITSAINEATAKGIIVVVSAGNIRTNVDKIIPANVESAIVIGAVNEKNILAKYSNYGNTVDYVSYGMYNGKEGTSYAAANVTGIISDILSKEEDISLLDKYIIKPNNNKDVYGKGIASLYNYLYDGSIEDEDDEGEPIEVGGLSEDYMLTQSTGTYTYKYSGGNEYTFTYDTNTKKAKIKSIKIGNKDGSIKPDSTITINKVSYTITEIENNALKNNTTLKKAELPKTITTIGDYAFYGCSNLATLTLKDGLTTIGDYAFYNCPRLSNITIPSTVTKLGYNTFRGSNSFDLTVMGNISSHNNAFKGNTSIKKLTVKGSTTTIYKSMFEGCTGITSMYLNEAKKLTTVQEKAFYGCTGLCSKGKTTTSNLGSVGYPKTTTSVGKDAFKFYEKSSNTSSQKPPVTVSQTAAWTDKANGIAKVTLSAKADTLSVQTAKDYIIIMDCSGSMGKEITVSNGKKKTKLALAKESLKSFIDMVSAENANNRICIVTFAWDKFSVYKDWTSINSQNAQSIKNLVDNLKSGSSFKWGDKAMFYAPNLDGSLQYSCATQLALRSIQAKGTTNNTYAFVLGDFEDGKQSQVYAAAQNLKGAVEFTYVAHMKKENSSTANANAYRTDATHYSLITETNKFKDQLDAAYSNLLKASTISAQNTTLKSVLNTRYWQVQNANGLTNSNGTLSKTGLALSSKASEYVYYIKLKEEYRNTSSRYAVSNDINASYTILGGINNGKTDTARNTTAIYLDYDAPKYTITYNANGGTGAPASQTKTYGKNLTLSSTKPTRANSSTTGYTVTFNAGGGTSTGATNNKITASRTITYSFNSWNTKSNGSGVRYLSGGGYTANESAILYAQWNTGSTVVQITLPTPTRQGYTFNGWYTASSGGTRIGGAGAKWTPTGNVTLYAQWNIGSYTVSYNANGGTGAPANQTKNHGSNLTLSTTKPTRSELTTTTITVNLNANGGSTPTSTLTSTRKTGYAFNNWKATNGKTYNPGGIYSENASTTMTAQWINNTVAEVLTLPTPTRDGHTFDGWYTAASGGTKIGNAGAKWTPTENTTLYAHWIMQNYTITYNANGGTGAPANQTKNYGSNLTLSTTRPTRTNANNETYTVTFNANGGSVNTNSLTSRRTTTYTFKNWNTNSNGTGTSYSSGGTYTANESAILYAQWNTSETKDSITLPSPATRSGYTFDGWYTAASGGTKIGNAGARWTPDGNVTLYAHWNAISYTIKYYGGGATSGSTADQTFVYGVSQNLRQNGFSKVYNITYDTKGGSTTPSAQNVTATFKNWRNQTKTYTNNQSVNNLTATQNGIISMTAEWDNKSITLPSAPTKRGYKFLGWYKSNETDKIGDAGSEYTPESSQTIIAKWDPNRYNIEFEGNGQTGGTMTPQTNIKYDTEEALKANRFIRKYTLEFEANEGSSTGNITVEYAFKNWNTEANGTGNSYANTEIVKNLVESGNTKLYAQWNLQNVELPTTTRPGYTFAGWYRVNENDTNSSVGKPLSNNSTNIVASAALDELGDELEDELIFVGNAGDFIIPTSDLLLFAGWIPNTDTRYEIEYYLQDTELSNYNLGTTKQCVGTTEATVSVATSDIVEINGFRFMESDSRNVTSGVVQPDGSLKLKLYYARNAYPVILDANGGSINSGNITEYIYGKQEALPTDVTKIGYTFSGWHERQDLTDAPVTRIGAEKTGEQRFYASWQENTDTKYVEEYYLQNTSLNGYMLEETQNKTGTTNALVTITSKNYYGFEFDSSNTNNILSANILPDGTLALKRYYNRMNYDVVLNTNGGTINSGNIVSYTYGINTALPTDVTKLGYTFKGWYRNSELTDGPVTQIEATESGNKEFYASWIPNTDIIYKAEYYKEKTNLGEYELADYELYEGTTDATVQIPDKTYQGFVFTENPNNAQNILSGQVKSDGSLVLKKYYNREHYQINYIKNEGTINSGEITEYVYGKQQILPTDVTKQGYNFEGWYADEGLTEGPIFATAESDSGNKTYYAKWTPKNDTRYVEEYYRQNSSLDGYTVSRNNKTGTTGSTATIDLIDITGFEFEDDNPNNILQGQIQPDGSLVLKRYYKRNHYAITLNTNGGTINEGNVTEYIYGKRTSLPTNVTKEGYIFDGWYLDETLNNGPIRTIGTQETGDKTYYAKWIINEYTVTFIDEGMLVKVETVKYSSSATAPYLSKPGYTLTWNKDFSSITADTEVETRWIPNTDTPYSIEYYLRNTDTEVEGYLSPQIDDMQGTTDTQAIATPREFTGFTYNENHSQNVKSGTITADGKLVLKLYYNRNIYSISYELNGGTVNSMPTAYVYGKDTTLPKKVTKEGSTFLGWYDNPSFTGQPIESIKAEETGNKKLYARWSEVGQMGISSATYRISDDGHITKINPNTSVDMLLSKIDTTGSMRVVNTNNQEITDNTIVGTGYKLQVTHMNDVYTYTLVVKGDLNGDGKVTTTDIAILNNAFIGKAVLTQLQEKAIKEDTSKSISVTDLSNMYKLLIYQ